jgi:hypothetical protein
MHGQQNIKFYGHFWKFSLAVSKAWTAFAHTPWTTPPQSMEKSPSSEGNQFAASQEIPHFMEPKDH